MRHISKFLILILITFLTGACQKKEDGKKTEVGEPSRNLIVGNGSDPETLDPQVSTGQTAFNVLNALYDPLLRFDPRTGKMEPVSIEKYTVSEDGKTYTFHLLKDAKWSNGDPVVADDWAAGFRRALRPEISTPYLQLFASITNALAYNKGEATWEDVGIKAPDDYTLIVSMDTPKLFFISSIAQTCFYPIHRPSMEPFGAETSITTNYFNANSLIGNGAFSLVEWTEDDKIVVKKHPHYHSPEKIKLDTITYRAIANADTELRTYETGGIQKSNTVPPTKLRDFRETQRSDMRSDDLFGTYFFRFNVERPPLDNVKVRKALALSIDRFEITNFVTNGGQPPANTMVPPGVAYYTSPEGFEEDIKKAQELLAEAGFPNGEGFPELTLMYNTYEAHRLVAQAVQQMWKENLGIHIKLLNQEWKVFLKTTKDGDFDIARAGWVGGSDPEGYLDLFRSESGNNHGRYSNPEFDALFSKASQQPNQETRMKLFKEAEALAMDEMPIIPVYHYFDFYMLRPDVQNWLNNPTGAFILDNVQIGEGQ